MYFVGIDVSKYKHDCFILNDLGEVVVSHLVIANSHTGFSVLLSTLESLDDSHNIRIGFEATGHYTSNLKRFLENAHYSFMESNPALISKYIHSQTLRKTKNDSIDARSIAHWLMTVDYKPYPIGFYHTYSLKSLTRLRDTLVRQRTLYMVKLTNILDHIFPEFKPFFKNRFSQTALFLLEKYHTPDKMARMKTTSYDPIRSVSRGKFSMQRFLVLKDLAANTVGDSNDIFETQLISVLNLYRLVDTEVQRLESEIISLITELNPRMLTIPGIGPISAAIIYSEYGDVNQFPSPSQMLSFAGLEPGYFQSGTMAFTGKMVKRGSSHLRYALMNCTMPLIMNNMVFAAYYHKKRQEGKPHRVALSHVAKKLIRVIYTLETTNVPFDASKLR
jgi:transposase